MGLSLTACQPLLFAFYTMSPPKIYSLSFGLAILFFVAIVLAKSFLFYYYLRRSEVSAVRAMIIANVFTSIVGYTAVGLTSSGAFVIGGIVGAYIAFRISLQHIFEAVDKKRIYFLNPSYWSLLLTGLYFVAVVAALMLEVEISPSDTPLTYWLVKLGFSFLGVLISLIMTILVESTVCVYLLRKRVFNIEKIINASVSANVVIFLSVFLIGALIAFPKRLAHPQFLYRP